jgi:hypothetical protein
MGHKDRGTVDINQGQILQVEIMRILEIVVYDAEMMGRSGFPIYAVR